MATSYPKFTSASTGKTTYSNGTTTSTIKPATISKPQTKDMLASIVTALYNIGGYVANPKGTTTSQLTSSVKDVYNTAFPPMNSDYSGPSWNGFSAPSIPPKPSKMGIASKQSAPVINSSGRSISGAYTTNSLGQYQEVPISSLSQGVSPDVSNNVRRISDKLSLSINTAKNDPFSSSGTTTEKIGGIMESTAGDFAKNFNSGDELNLAYNSNPTIKNSLDKFIANGGTLDQVLAKIQSNQAQNQPYTIKPGDTLNAISARTGKSVQEIMALNPNITNPNLIQAGSALNLGATTGGTQDTASYLAEVKSKVVTDPEKLLNMPQDELMRNEIMRQMNIPKEYKDLYFGTPEKIGILEKEKSDAEERIKLIEEKEADKKQTIREKANFEIDKYRQQASADDAEVETNRLKSKNYMMGMLAKLGAINTTGASAEALTNLDFKYNKLKLQTRQKYDNAIREMEIAMNEDINNTEATYDEKAQAVREDLTKSTADITKELLKLQNESQSKIYSIASSYSKLLKTQQSKLKKTVTENATQYVTDFRNLVSIGQTPGLAFLPGANKAQLDQAYLTKNGTKIPVITAIKTNKTKTTSSGDLTSRLEAMLK